MSQHYAGIYPILYAFFNADGDLDRGAMRLQVERCLAAGAHGIAVLGLVTEVNKLSLAERQQVVAWAAEDIGGKVPLAVTVAEPSVRAQQEFVKFAEDQGADWVILQPPPVKGAPEAEYIRFFGAVAAAAKIPVAIQNNPVNLDVWLSNDSLIALRKSHANITLLKGEGPAVHVASLIAAAGDVFDIFTGRGGLEFMSSLRSGCRGLIPAPDVLDLQVKLFNAFERGDADEAEALHRQCLPEIVFMSQSVPLMLCYGKRLMARRLGLSTVHSRGPDLGPTPFGLAEIERFFDQLGPL